MRALEQVRELALGPVPERVLGPEPERAQEPVRVPERVQAEACVLHKLHLKPPVRWLP